MHGDIHGYNEVLKTWGNWSQPTGLSGKMILHSGRKMPVEMEYFPASEGKLGPLCLIHL